MALAALTAHWAVIHYRARGKLRSVIFFLAAYMPPLRIRAERKGEENVAYCAGDLREHMDVLAKTDSADGRGFPVQAWTVAHASVACSVSDVSGRDFYAAYAAGAQNTVTFVCRYIAGVNTANRVRYQGGDYEILQVNHLQEKRDFMQLKCMRAKA